MFAPVLSILSWCSVFISEYILKCIHFNVSVTVNILFLSQENVLLYDTQIISTSLSCAGNSLFNGGRIVFVGKQLSLAGLDLIVRKKGKDKQTNKVKWSYALSP